MRWLLTLLVLLPSLALAQFPISRGGTVRSGPRILGEPAFAFELDALEQAEASRPGWPVTTTRASTRMCWTGSAWQTVPENTPCIGASGLASFGAGTNYVTNSTRIDLFVRTGGALEENADGSYRLTDSDPAANTLLDSAGASVAAAGETWTATFELRAVSGSPTQMRIGPGGSTFSSDYCTVTITTEWRRYSCTKTSTAAGNANARLVFGTTSAATGSVDIRQAQLEKSPTPGPRHDCEAAPCSWAADVHTVSTAGWPVASGRIDLQYTAHTPTITTDAYLLYGGVGGVRLRRNASGSLAVFRSGVAQNGTVVDWSTARTISLRWDGAVAAVYIDGAHYMDIAGSVVTGAWDAVAYLGNSSSGSLPANGSIRLVRISE